MPTTKTLHLIKNLTDTWCGRKIADINSTDDLSTFNETKKTCKFCKDRHANGQRTRQLAVENKRRKTQWNIN